MLSRDRLCYLFAWAVTALLFALLPSTAAGQGGEPASHTVAWGETLSGIAYRFAVSMQALIEANDIHNPRLIYAGQRLVIPLAGATATLEATSEPVPLPEASGTPAAEPAATPEATPTPFGATTYTVQRGDNLSRIAARFGVTLADLLAANDIAEPNKIYSGTVLDIPPAGAPASGLTPTGGVPTPTVTEGKQIVVVLSQQSVYAFDNGAVVSQFLVSTGLPSTPTVQGEFAIYTKIEAQLMSGPEYYLPNVQWVSYFYRDYSFHGTYWHSNFGQPMSHGCVNMRTEDAKWLYDWAPIGTAVLAVE